MYIYVYIYLFIFVVTTVVASTYTLYFILLHCYSDTCAVHCNSIICEHCLKWPIMASFPNNLNLCNIKRLTIRRSHLSHLSYAYGSSNDGPFRSQRSNNFNSL